ncbi:Mrp/NBP35 family ATP-binding protein [bacterium AH-315-J21]|nr:Mrp/NBP35 family ATP-binding protein [bacterium AH-315-J21]
MISAKAIEIALRPVKDPELQHSIVALGMVGEIAVSGETVSLTLKMPLPGSPTEVALCDSIKETLVAIEGISEVTISTAPMSDAERMDLANKLHGRPSEGETQSGGASDNPAMKNATPLALNADNSIAETDPKRLEIAEALAKVEDPEINLPLTQLGMVKSIGIAGGDIVVEILLTIPGCPLKDKITGDIGKEIEKLKWVDSVGVSFGVMTEEQRQNVGKIIEQSRGTQPPAWKHDIKLEDIAKRIITVCSGKGGVGKSTTTTNLAFALASMGHQVGILDADVYGFSIPRMTGIHGQPVVENDRIEPLRKGNVQVMSMGYFIDEDAPVIWRGPLLHKAINQFLADVNWSTLDYLLIDLPPGTGDVTLTIAQALPTAEMLIVTTPQPVATHVAGRVAKLAERTKLKLLGVVENMSYLEVDGQKIRIFGEGGGRELAERLNIPLLGEAPLHQEIRERSDDGNPVASDGKTELSKVYFEIAEKIVQMEVAVISA